MRACLTFSAMIITMASCLLLTNGCDPTRPEVIVHYRGAIMEDSLVLIVTNAGEKPLFDVSIKTQRWEKTHTVSLSLRPGETAEAGWLELPSGLKSGDIVEIYAKGFDAPYKAEIP